MVKKEYQKLKEKYKLPSYADLDRAFDISSIEPGGKLLREIKKNVKEAFDKVLSFLGSMLQPELGDVVAFTNTSALVMTIGTSPSSCYTACLLFPESTLRPCLRRMMSRMPTSSRKRTMSGKPYAKSWSLIPKSCKNIGRKIMRKKRSKGISDEYRHDWAARLRENNASKVSE